MDKCALYLVRDHYSGAVKIGISKHPQKRLSQIAAHYAVGRVSIIKTTWFTTRDAARSWESNFHKRYRIHRSPEQGGREWFDLTDAQIQGFVEWMEASTNQRAIKIITVQAEAEKSDKELSADRWSGFWSGALISLFTGIVPAIGYGVTGGQPIGMFLAPVGVGAYAASKTKKIKTLSKAYQLDGQPLGSVALEREYKVMGLWDERTYTLSGVKSPSWKLPEATTAEQAQRFFEASK